MFALFATTRALHGDRSGCMASRESQKEDDTGRPSPEVCFYLDCSSQLTCEYDQGDGSWLCVVSSSTIFLLVRRPPRRWLRPLPHIMVPCETLRAMCMISVLCCSLFIAADAKSSLHFLLCRERHTQGSHITSGRLSAIIVRARVEATKQASSASRKAAGQQPRLSPVNSQLALFAAAVLWGTNPVCLRYLDLAGAPSPAVVTTVQSTVAAVWLKILDSLLRPEQHTEGSDASAEGGSNSTETQAPQAVQARDRSVPPRESDVLTMPSSDWGVVLFKHCNATQYAAFWECSNFTENKSEYFHAWQLPTFLACQCKRRFGAAYVH